MATEWEDVSPTGQVADAVWEDVETIPAGTSEWEDVPELPKGPVGGPVGGGQVADFEEETSVWDAFKGGFQEDISFAFGDEAAALYDSFKNKPEGEDVYGETYVEAREENRRYLKRLEKEHGTAYFLGGLTGSAALTAATVGVVAATGGVAAPVAVGSLAASTGVKSAAKALAKKAAKNAATGAKVGAVEGALFGAGKSEADLIEGKFREAIQDAAKGALVGGVVGAGLGAGLTGVGYVGGKGIEKLGKKFKKDLDEAPIAHDVIDMAETKAQSQARADEVIGRLYESEPEEIISAMNGDGWINTVSRSERKQIQNAVSQSPSQEHAKMTIEEYYGAYLRHDMRSFLDYAGVKTKDIKTTANFDKKSETWDWPGEGAMTEAIKQAKKEGKLTKEMFSSYRQSQYMMESAGSKANQIIQNIHGVPVGKETATIARARALIDHGASADPMSGYVGWFNKKVMSPFVHAARIDRKTGIDMEGALYRATKNDQLAANYVYTIREPLKNLEKKAKIHDLYDDATKITEDIEAGIQHELLDEPRRLLREAKEFLDDQGFKFEGRGEDYIPHMRKRGNEYLQAMINKSDDVVPYLETLDREDLNKLFDSVGQKHLGKRDDVTMFIHELNEHSGEIINSIPEMNKAIAQLSSPKSVKKSLSREVSFAKHREGETPHWLREKNIYKLLYQYHNLVGDVVFRQKSARELSTLQSVLQNQFKMRESSDWLKKYLMDYTGQWRDSYANKALAMKTTMALRLENKPALQAMFNMTDLFTRALYPNMLGMNVRAMARNMTQPWVMTLPEAGYKNTDKMMGAYAKLMSPSHFKKIQKELYDRGYAKEFYTEEDASTIRFALGEGTKNRGLKVAKDVLDWQSEVVMAGYKWTDLWNRSITLQFTKDIAQEIIKNPKSLSKFKGHVSDGTLRNVRRALDKGDAQAVEDVFTDYFMAKTQLIYGKVGMHEFGRDMGPFFSMFTTWPSFIYSDVYDKLSQKQFVNAANKYLAPYMVGTAMTSAWMPEKHRTRRQEELVGRGGFQGTLPINSLTGVSDMFGHKLLDSGTKGVGEVLSNLGPALEGDKNAQRRMWQVGKRMSEIFLPMGGVPRQAEHLYYLFGPEGSRRVESTRK